MMVNPPTVLGMFKELAIPKGEFLAQNAAGSVLGRQVIQLARHYGIKTVNIVRRAAQIPELKELGADVVICSEGLNPEQLGQEIVKLCGKRPFAAIDAVAGESCLALSNAVRDGAWIYNYGLISGLVCQVSGPSVLFRDIRFKGFWVTTYLLKMTHEERSAFFKELLDLMEKKILVPFAGNKYPLDQVKEAVKASNEVGRGGKILLSS
jgi:NADPH:quinone reductase-like Zn-dependent oxidoreductase